MEKIDTTKKAFFKRWGLILLRSFLLILLFALFFACSDFTIRLGNYDPYGQYYFLSDPALCRICVMFSLLFYYSVMRSDALDDDGFCGQYCAIWERSDPPGFFRRFRFALLSPGLRVHLAVHTLALLILPFGFRPLTALLGANGNRGIRLLILIPTLAVLCIAARASALSAWSVRWGRKAGKPRPEKVPPLKQASKLFLIWICFTVAGMCSPIVIRTLFSIFDILKLANPWVALPIVVGVILLWNTVRFSIAAGKRRRLLRRLRKYCAANGYELTDVKKCVRTLFFPCTGANFTIRKGENRYDCRLISSMGRHSPLLFREEGTVTCTHILRFFSLNLFHYNFTYDYQFEGTGTKLLILLPAPHEVFVSGYGVTQLAFPGSRIADCILYGATDFLHALERDVIGRS